MPTAEVRTLKNADGTTIIYPETISTAIYSPSLGTNIEDGFFSNVSTSSSGDFVTLDTDQTITGQKTFSSNTIAVNYPVLNVTQTGTISDYTGGRGIDFIAPNLASGGILSPIYFGKSFTAGNGGAIHFHWIGDNDAGNCISLSLYSSNDILRVYKNKNVSIDEDVNTYKLNVNGSENLKGTLHIRPTSGNYSQGIRIDSYPSGTNTDYWATILLKGSDNTADTGTSANSWGIFNNDGSFYINQNGANAAKSARAWASSTGWTFGNTTLHDMAFNVENFQCGGTSWFHNKVTISRNTSIANNYPAELAFRVIQSDNSVTTNTAFIRVYDDHDASSYGTNMVIQSAGNVIIGAGESPNSCYTTDLLNSTAENMYITSDNNIYFYTNCNTYSNHTTSCYINTAGVLYGAAWNDYAEFRQGDSVEPGYVMVETGKDTVTKSSERLQAFAGVSSDTFGFSIGETKNCQTPIAVSGRVLVYTYRPRDEYKPGDCVCAAAGGTVDIMTREEVRDYPDRIVGTVSAVPDYETWGEKEVSVNGRIWIKVR